MEDNSTGAPPTPRQLGFRWPAEWEPHRATWLTWPHNPDTWPGRLAEAQREFAEFVRTLACYEPVELLVADETLEHQVRSLLGRSDNLSVHRRATNDSWVRDYGPTFLLHAADRSLAAVDWRYNAWGGKYGPWDRDDRIAAWITQLRGCPQFDPGIVLEGGAIEGNGRGTVLTTPQCLLNPNRNPGMNRQRMEALLSDYLAADQVCWLEGAGIEGDDTDGHIDQLARFVNARTVVAATSPEGESAAGPLDENLRRLRDWREADGGAWDVIALPLPGARFCQGQRLPASYCNFYIANGAVLVPQFQDPADDRALAVLGELFPDREVLGVPALELVWGLGAFHCLSQQEPRPS